MKQLVMFFVLTTIGTGVVCSQEQLKTTLPDGQEISHKVIFKERDSLNGRVLAVFASNPDQVAFSGYFMKGKPNGRFLYYQPNGHYHQTMIYGYGKLHGDYTIYDNKGNITIKGKYKNGLKHGYWKDRENNVIGRYRKGKRFYIWKRTDDSGKRVLEKWHYKKGELVKGDRETAAKLRL